MCRATEWNTQIQLYIFIAHTIHYNELYWTFIINTLYRAALVGSWMHFSQFSLFFGKHTMLSCVFDVQFLVLTIVGIKCDNLWNWSKPKTTRINDTTTIKMKEWREEARNSMGWLILYCGIAIGIHYYWNRSDNRRCSAMRVLSYVCVYGVYTLYRQYWIQQFIVRCWCCFKSKSR